MIQTIFTRKNLIVIALSVFFALVLLFTGVCLDAGSTMLNTENPIAMIGASMGFSPIIPGMGGFLSLILVAFYIIILVTALLYEHRCAVINNVKSFAPKMLGIYAATALVCALLSVGVGILFQKPINAQNIGNMFRFIGQSLLIAAIIYGLLFLIIGAVLMFVVNFINIDKPFKFFGENQTPIFDDEDLHEDGDIQASFDSEEESLAAAAAQGGAMGGAGGAGGAGGIGNGDIQSGETSINAKDEIGDAEKVFPSLARIDEEYQGYPIDILPTADITLEELCEQFRNYLAKVEKLYFDIDTIRFFISGFAASQFEILEGLSGTGKSSLPRYFAKFVNGRVLFMPVQATWRDKSNILGFFNEFSSTYTETEFLVELYRANYNPDMIHMFVLDEMNISRVEYYFADLLSVLEYPKEDWKLKVMQLPYGFLPPVKLDEGYIQIPENSYFVGTANKDDSTFTITDKVYDRAITMEFNNSNTPFEVEEDADTINLSYSKLSSLYKDAASNEENRLNEEDREKFTTITSYVYEEFGIAIGNRILTQIDTIVPVFVACGGTKEAALDFMLSKKVVSKVEGRFEEHIKDSLKGLLALIDKTYGAGVLNITEKTAKNIIRTL